MYFLSITSLKLFRKYHNLQIPELPEIITNYVIQKQETIEMFLDKRIDIDELLEFIAQDYSKLTLAYTVKSDKEECTTKENNKPIKQSKNGI